MSTSTTLWLICSMCLFAYAVMDYGTSRECYREPASVPSDLAGYGYRTVVPSTGPFGRPLICVSVEHGHRTQCWVMEAHSGAECGGTK